MKKKNFLLTLGVVSTTALSIPFAISCNKKNNTELNELSPETKEQPKSNETLTEKESKNPNLLKNKNLKRG